MFLSRKIRYMLLAVVLGGAALAVVMEFTDWHELQAVTLNGKPVEHWDRKLGLVPGQSVLKQPVETAARKLLKDTATARVDIAYHLPGELAITTNRFEPTCYVLDKLRGRLYGINSEGRFVPLHDDFNDWEQPVLTGVEVTGLYRSSRDHRVTLVMPQLVMLADDNRDLYRLIDEIDFSEEEYVLVTLSGLSFQMKTDAERFYDEISGFIQSVERFPMQVGEARMIDLRFENLIVQTGGAE